MRNAMCLKVVVAAGYLLFFQHGLTAQAMPGEPIEVAARYVIALEDLGSLGPFLTLDVQRSFGSSGSRQLTMQAQAAGTRIAQSLGAQAGDLNSVMICPPAPPSPEGAYKGCQFKGSTRVLVQVSDPDVTAKGLLVWVATWRLVENPSLNSYYIAAAGRQVALERGSDGNWIVTGVKRENRSMW